MLIHMALVPVLATAQVAPSPVPFTESLTEAEIPGGPLTLIGEWKTTEMPELSGGAALSSSTAGAAVEFDFTGSAVAADMVAGKSSGRMSVSVDGRAVATIDMYRGHMSPDIERVLLANDLAPGAHTLRIEVLSERNPLSVGSYVTIDALRAANAPFASVSGVLECRYNQGLPVSRARVTASGDNQATDVITGVTGDFTFSALAPGNYTLHFEHPGFIPLDLADIRVASGQKISLDNVAFEEQAGARPLTYIRSPLPVRPVIVRPGDEFPIEVAAPASTTGWRAVLDTAWATADLELKDAAYNAEKQRWTLRASAPIGTKQLLYDLRLSFDGGQDFQPRAVMVVPEFKDSLRVVHLTDVHVYKSEKLFDVYQQLAEEINLINPDIIVVTGDLTDSSGYTDETWPESDQYPAMLNLWNAYNAPTFILPGNHDLSPFKKQDDYVRWYRFFDTTDFSFNVGPYHFTAFDNSFIMTSTGHSAPYAEDIAQEQLDWMEKDLSENAGAAMRILLFHVPLHFTESKVKEIASRYHVKLALYGHVHMNAVDKMPPTTYVQTGSAFEGFYRVLNLDQGEIGQITAKNDGFSSSQIGTVESRTKVSDDGRSFTIQAKNSSIQDMPRASWRVEMPAAAHYTCESCTIVSQFAKGEKTLVVFTFDIPAKGVATAVLSAE